jgi:acetyl-CoA carboxylase biotin carboxylase subunit
VTQGKIKKLLIANRGEIAVRIIRAARDLGIATVQVHSDADTESRAVRMADEAVNIGPPAAAKSYLNVEAILKAARDSGADAIHPGYGFLAENADFADAVADAGLIFVGPSGDTIRLMGDKAAARAEAKKANVPTVPGSDGVIGDMDAAARLAEEIGFPVMIKASAGGGGRGIRIANDGDEFRTLAPQASSEAKAAFGDGGIYIEKVIERARHIEVQVLGDGEDAVHFFERECSLQRRRQKVWEEAPSIALGEGVREELCAAAVALTKAVNYKGAGTIEFLYDDKTGEFYFIEMNTRIQVEHPVTEMVCGVDLVADMITIAGGGKLRVDQSQVTRSGHAIEVRLNAEDPANNFMPFPGVVGGLLAPDGPGVRFDHMLYPGYAVPPFYDSLLGKLIVWAEDRDKALMRLKRALDELQIDGLPTTAPLFQALLESDDVRASTVHTRWLEPWLAENLDLIRQKGGSET